MMNEAMGIVADGIASPADVAIAMQLGAGMKSGPLHTADLVGHDVNLAIMETLYLSLIHISAAPVPRLPTSRLRSLRTRRTAS